MIGKILVGSLMALAICLTVSPFASAEDFTTGVKIEKKWMQYFYRANGVAPAPKPSSLMPGGGVGFAFLSTPDTAQFLTGHPYYNASLLGDLTGKTVSADVQVTATPGTQFTYYGQGSPSNPCGTPANVRLYFSTQNNDLGESQYWWSNPTSYELAAIANGGTVNLSAALDPANWSDRDGHLATYDAAHTAAFNAAVADVQQIGLSYGSGCFFANGVGATNGTATFTL